MAHRHIAAASAILLLAAMGGAPVMAGELFGVDATGTGGPVSVAGSSLPDLLDSAINGSGAFSGLSGDITINTTYGGVPNAIVVGVNTAGTSATLDIPGIGFSKTFTGTDKADLQKQIEDFLKQSGADIYADFLAYINLHSPAGIVDGNPSAMTAMVAQHAFDRWGVGGTDWTPISPMAQIDAARATARTQAGEMAWPQTFSGGAGLYAHVSAFGNQYDLDGFDSKVYGAEWGLGYRFNNQVGLFGTFLGAYQDIEGSKIYRGSYELALPITVVDRTENNGARLQMEVTPLGTISLVGSEDMGNGGLFYGYGLATRATWQLNGGLRLGMGVQYLKDADLTVSYQGYEFKTVVDQAVFSYGLDVGYALGSGMEFIVGGQRHELTEGGYDDQWYTLRAGLRVGGPKVTCELSYQGTYGDKVDGQGIIFKLNWRG